MALTVSQNHYGNRPPIVFALGGGAGAADVARLLELLGRTAAESQDAQELLRRTLTPLQDVTREIIPLSPWARRGLTKFLHGGTASGRLLRALSERADLTRRVLAALESGTPVDRLAAVIAGVPRAVVPADEPVASLTTTGPFRRPLEYVVGRRSAEALVQQRDALVASFARFERAITARGGPISVPEVPRALSIKDLLAQPDQVRERLAGENLPVAILDLSGTMKRRARIPVPWGGQVSLEWAIEEAVLYGPRDAVGLGWGQVKDGILRGLRLRRQEAASGTVDRKVALRVIGEVTRGIDGKRAERSFDRYLARQEGLGFSQWVLEEVEHFRRLGALLLVITADPQYVAQRISHELFGIPPENVRGLSIGLDPQGRGTGEVEWPHDEEKVVVLERDFLGPLRSAGFTPKLIAFMTDSESDLPVAEMVWGDGGLVYGVNPPRRSFEQEVLRRGGMVVREGEGERRTLFFSHPVGGEIAHRLPLPPERPIWRRPVGRHLMRVASDAAGMAVAVPVSAVVRQAVSGSIDWGMDLFSRAPQAAAAGLVASGLTFLVAPETGPVSGARRVLFQGMLPLMAAVTYGGLTGDFGPWYSDAAGVIGTTVTGALASEALTVRGRLIGLRTRGDDEVRSPGRKILGFATWRSIQLTVVRLLDALIRRLVS